MVNIRRIFCADYCKNADYRQVCFDLKENIHDKLAENGIKVPFNQIDVHVVEGK